jgi:hypothetical protein
MHDQNHKTRHKHTKQSAPNAKPVQKTVPRFYEVVVACRDEVDQRTVFERMRAEGYHCRVLTL